MSSKQTKGLFLLSTIFLLLGCAETSTDLVLAPIITVPAQNLRTKNINLSIEVRDLRQDLAVAKIRRNNQLIPLNTSTHLTALLADSLSKQLQASGYLIKPIRQNNHIQLTIKQLHANVQEGYFAHNITAKVELSLLVSHDQYPNYQKNYQTTQQVEGPLNASNEDIVKAINQALSNVIKNMAQDNELQKFITSNTF